MSDLWETFEGVPAEEVVYQINRLGRKGLDYLGSLMRNELTPYVEPLWIDPDGGVCRARLIPSEDRKFVVRELAMPPREVRTDPSFNPEDWNGNFYMFSDKSEGPTEEYFLDDIVFKRIDVEGFFNPDNTKDRDTNGMKRTDAASKGRDKKTAENWADYLYVAVKMTIDIMENGKREYTKRELVQLAKRHGGEWKEESRQMTAFRKALPPGYTNTGGAPKQE